MNHKLLYLKYYKVVLSTKEVSVGWSVSQVSLSVCQSVKSVGQSFFLSANQFRSVT